MYPIAFLSAEGELFFIDQLAALKIHAYCWSPYIQARSKFWEDLVELFPAYSSATPCFYWQHGPQLALPESADSLLEKMIEETPID